MTQQFKQDIHAGLSAVPKSVSSKYLYDETGSLLFTQIMQLDEYYLTRSELEIFQTQIKLIINAFGLNTNTYFELIELGAGNGLKTKRLLEALTKKNYNFSYIPVDISKNALNGLEQSLKTELATLSVKPKCGEYFQVLKNLIPSNALKIVLFLGSSLGNLSDKEAGNFIENLSTYLNKNDQLFLGVDLIKPTSIVLPAYNDQKGITKAFNLNLLSRINKQLGANFDIQSFSYEPQYCEQSGIVKSYLKSRQKQTVHIEALDQSFLFKRGEKMLTEISRKYDDQIIANILQNTGFEITNKFSDSQQYFANYLLNQNR